MRVVSSADDLAAAPFRAVALGNFDGVHVGHASLINATVACAKEQGGESIVFSFFPHPQEVLGSKGPDYLASKKLKECKLAQLEVDALLNCPFTRELAAMSAEDFIEKILLQQVKANHIFVGFNYSFGYKASGTPQFLKEYCEARGCAVSILPPVECECGVVSSTLIRNLLTQGKVDAAAKLLGCYYSIEGVVVHGQQLGRKIGYPTANLQVNEHIKLPMRGVYAAFFEVEGQLLKAMVNIGYRPTVDDSGRVTVEANCLNFDGDLYGKEAHLHFVSFIRPEQRFDGVDKLIAQLGRDVQTTDTCTDLCAKPELFSKLLANHSIIRYN